MLILFFTGSEYTGMVLGHEISGTVASLPEDVNKSNSTIKVGDRVLVFPWIAGCGECDACHDGSGMVYCTQPARVRSIGVGCSVGGISHGGFATHVVVPDVRYVVKVPDSIPMEIAAMLPCSALTTFTALTKAKASLEIAGRYVDEPGLLIMGTGGLGVWSAILSRHVFGSLKVKVICADTLANKRKIALEAGADEFVAIDNSMSGPAMAAKIKAVCQDGVYAAIDCVGKEQTVALAFHTVSKGGKVVILGLHGGSFTMPVPRVITKAITLEGSLVGTIKGLKKLIDLVASQKIAYPKIEKYTLNDVNEIISKLRNGRVDGRAMLDFVSDHATDGASKI